MTYEGHERRRNSGLSDEEIEAIAERAAEKAIERVYTQIGKSVVTKFLWLCGAAGLALYAWLSGSGHFK